MDKLLKQTKYRHVFNSDGSKRAEPCSGLLEIRHNPIDGTHVVCGKCAEGYKFQFVMRRTAA